IFYRVLLSQIIDENDLDDHQFDYEVKKQVLEPAFIRIAEQLKIALCEKLEQRIKKQERAEVAPFTASVSGEFICELADGTELVLTDPTLILTDFNKLLEPFLDQDRLFVKKTEYRQTLSIFTPIQDAIGRNNLSPKDIDLCLLVGGSCLIPQVRDAVEQFFSNAEILSFDGADAMQTAIARGAAINALALALTQQPVIQPVCQESIAIMTATGSVELLPQQTALPWPDKEGYAKGPILTIPTDSEEEAVNLRVEIVSRDNSGQRTLLSEIWEVPPPIRAGEKVQVESRFDLNQVLQLRLVHLERENVPIYEKQEEHPFTHVANPQKVKIRIEKAEENLRTGKIPEPLWNKTMTTIADDCAELRQYEKAISLMAAVMGRNNQADIGLMNKMALYAGYMGDRKREEQIYRAALEEDSEWGTLWFNLALLLQKQNRLEEARQAINTAIKVEPDEASYYVLQAKFDKESGKNFAIVLDLADIHARNIDDQNSWELYWSIVAAELRGNKKRVEIIRKLRQRKSTDRDNLPSREDGCLPDIYREVEG
ncbi:MAG: Hsp70 family protein, partial [Desulfuromusa sp.]|nr:Hsp70 family protein [Desulfuromusa sp.]